jgi:ribonuclease-3
VSKADPVSDLESRIGWRFSNRELLRRALTHSSFGDGKGARINYERLEFLGDRVLNLLAAQRLCVLFPAEAEGGLAPRLNQLVRRETCARVARRAGLDAVLYMAESEARAGGRNKDSILGDACEALLGALYLDGGLLAAEAFFERYWSEEMAQVQTAPQDPKTRLQEWALARALGTPVYALVSQTGPDHKPRFVVEARLGERAATGEGDSKQAAERAAASALYALIGHD